MSEAVAGPSPAGAIVRARILHPKSGIVPTREENGLRALMGAGGIQDCGQSRNRVEVCPKSIPLTTPIAEMFRETTFRAIEDRVKREAPREHAHK